MQIFASPAFAGDEFDDAEAQSDTGSETGAGTEEQGTGGGLTAEDPAAEDDISSDGTDGDSPVKTGIVEEDGCLYYYDENGELMTLCWVIDPDTGKVYFAGEDGALIAGQFIQFGDDKYFALENGEIVSGVFEDSGNMYYSDPETLTLQLEAGWTTQDGNAYYVLGNGVLATGFLNLGGTTYCFGSDGCLQTGFYEVGGQLRYSFPDTGAVITYGGWLETGGERYFADANGCFYRNRLITFGDHGFYLGSDGRVLRTPEEIMEQSGMLFVVKDESGELPLGWYTDGAGDRYYQTRTGVLRGDVVMDHRKYRFDQETGRLVSLVGIDVSEWQGDIDWARVKADGIDFVFIRIGGRGGSSGAIYNDDKAAENIRGALDAGLRVGVYFFTQAVSAAEGKAEAQYVLDRIRGYDITFPVVIDTEELFSGGRHNWISPAARTAAVLAFCTEIAKAGYIPMVYASAAYFEDWWLLDSQLGDILHWVAEIFGDPDAHNDCSYNGDVACWQYSWEGEVDGIDYPVDMNIWYMNVMMPWTRECA